MDKKKEKSDTKMKIVSIIPFKKTIFAEDLSYFTSKEVAVGDVVEAVLKNKKILGLVSGVEDLIEQKNKARSVSFQMRKITEVKGASVFNPSFTDSVLEIADFFVTSKNSAFSYFFPTFFLKHYDILSSLFSDNKKVIKNTDGIKPEKDLFQTNLEDRLSFYKTLIRGYFASKKSVFMVLPTENDIDFFYSSLSKGIENFTFSFYSGMSEKKVLEQCKKIAELENASHGVFILGTAPFLSLPLSNIGCITLEKENSNAYRTILKPHFDLRIFAEIFAYKIKAKFILADSLLRIESLAKKDTEGWGEVSPLSFRIEKESSKIEIINPKKEKEEKQTFKFSVLTEKTKRIIGEHLSSGKNVFIFALRKGLASYTVCRDCGDTLFCEKCMAPLVLYASKNGKNRIFICNKCNSEKDTRTSCERCKSWNLMSLGIGVDALYEEIANIFPDTKCLKLDKDSIKNKEEAEKLVSNFFLKNKKTDKQGKILLGTEMSFFYLKDQVDLSVLASFDSLWTVPNFRMNEKIIKIILACIGLSKNSVIIQTKNDEDEIISSILSGNLLPYIRKSLEERKMFNYPPFSFFVKISFLGDKEEAVKAREMLSNVFSAYNPEIFGNFVSSEKNLYSAHALLRLPKKSWSLPSLIIGTMLDPELKNLFSSLPPNFSVLIDPEELI